MTLFIQKIYSDLNKNPVFQVRGYIENVAVKKAFLQFDISKKFSEITTLSEKKPQSLGRSLGITEKLRKEIAGLKILNSRAHPSKQAGIVFGLSIKENRSLYIWIEGSKPKTLHLVEKALDNQSYTSLIRKQGEATYTKKSELENFVPEEFDLEESFEVRSAASLKNTENEAQKDSAHLKAPEKIILKSLKRKLKTFEKSYESKKKKFSHLGELESDLRELVSKKNDLKVLDFKTLDKRIDKLKRQIKGHKKYAEVLSSTKSSVDQLRNEIDDLKNAKGFGPEFLSKKYKISLISHAKDSQSLKNSSKRQAYFEYDLGSVVRVGKDARGSDELVKAARSNFTWMHSVKPGGSHVIICDSKPSQDCVHQAGILALHYSKQRKSMSGEVYLGRKLDLKKTKDLAPGKWIIGQCKSLFLKYSETELKNVLDRKL